MTSKSLSGSGPRPLRPKLYAELVSADRRGIGKAVVGINVISAGGSRRVDHIGIPACPAAILRGGSLHGPRRVADAVDVGVDQRAVGTVRAFQADAVTGAGVQGYKIAVDVGSVVDRTYERTADRDGVRVCIQGARFGGGGESESTSRSRALGINKVIARRARREADD